MCGITGLMMNSRRDDTDRVIRQMNQTLHHRGPDQDGVFLSSDGLFAFGHKRLSILDLSHGRQPMTDVDGLITIAFNGEIYNHREVKAELLRKGHPIASRSDTETLLYAYKEWGEGCLQKLQGMFAFAIHDAKDGSLFLARDRVGIKPLYYGFGNDAFVFGSECKALLAYPGFDRSMDLQALSDYLSLMYVPAPKSIYQRIRKLPAGHWLKIKPGGQPVIQQYWDLEFVDASEYGREKDFDRAQDDVLALLEECVKSHMESDVPLGAFLSGGLDSSAVVALMARNSTHPIQTNTVGFSHAAYDETSAARDTAGIYKTKHNEFTVSPQAVPALTRLAWHYDEPFADSSMIPTWYVCGMARRQVKVAMSGDGGDESFAGYRRYYYDALENRLRGYLPGALRKPVFGALAALYPKADWLPQPLRAKTLLRNLSFDPMRGYFTSMSHIHPWMKRQLLSDEAQRSLGGYDSIDAFEEHWQRCKSRDALSRVQYLDVKTYLVEDILTKVDRASMAVSLEVRVPLLDHRFMELAARLPSGWKIKGQSRKHLFREALRKLLPAPILTRPKTGFSIPMKEWLRSDLKFFGEDLLLGNKGSVADTGLFKRPAVEKMWREHQSGLSDHTYPLFALISFALWYRNFAAEGSGLIPPAGNPDPLAGMV